MTPTPFEPSTDQHATPADAVAARSRNSVCGANGLRRTLLSGLPLALCVALASSTECAHAAQDAVVPIDPPSAQVIDQTKQSTAAVVDRGMTEAQLRDGLARNFAQSARQCLQRGRVFLGSLDAARELLLQSVALAPTNKEIWRVALDLGAVLEEGDPIGAKLGVDALEALSRLDPQDEGIRLRRLLGVIEQRQTAEARIAVSLRMLAPESIPQIGPRVAARLAYELATLYKRTGDLEGYEHWLLEATRLDPWFPDAANEAAGFMRLRVGVLEEAGLLRAAALANPADGLTALALAQICLDNGAYNGAAGILEIECKVLQTSRPNVEYDTLLADLLLSFWGSGQWQAAESVYARRQQQLDLALRAEIDRRGALISLERRKEMQLPPTPVLITNVAAMLVSRRLEGAAVVVINTDSAFKLAIQSAEQVKLDQAEIASFWLQRAFVALWLGGTVEGATTSLATGVAMLPISAEARARFDGWFAFRANDFAKAESIFTPLSAADPASKMGLAMALEAQGRLRDAASQFLALAKAESASALGLYARESVWRLLGSTPQIFPDAPKLDAIASLPAGFRKVVEDPESVLLLTIKPRERITENFAPLRFDFVVTNRGDWPIAIAPNGPLRDTATAACSLSMSGQVATRIPPYEALSLSARLALAPGESVTAVYDATIGDGTRMFKLDPTVGGFATVHGILNWRTTTSGMEPGPLGVEVESDTVRVEGMRVESAWVAQAIAQISDPSTKPSPVTVAFLACALSRLETRPESIREDAQRSLETAAATLAPAIARLTPLEAAWVAAQVPPERKNLAGFYAALDALPDPLVRMARLVARTESPDEALIELTLRDGPVEAQPLARALKDHRLGIVEERRENLDISK
ncbi:MAG: hypothetical protein EXS10_05675 [Phycisphaerales bacterium]|nr:hypothetical protein [Phycisphaerales bacterium]